MQTKLIRQQLRYGRSPRGLLSFLEEVQQALNEGWKLPSMETVCIADFPLFAMQFSVRMHKEGEAEKEVVDVLEVIENKSLNKEELKAICLKEGIEYPDFPQPAKVRKHIKEAILAKRAGEASAPTEESGQDETPVDQE